ncbi:MAG: S8 family serine peptidase [Gemmatimonadaceae bacterium]|nr:S8 family serine peptidase [Gloeobacterales cyanobacterium ES-bin-141]
MSFLRFLSDRFAPSTLLAGSLLLTALPGLALPVTPENLGLGLREIVTDYHGKPEAQAQAGRPSRQLLSEIEERRGVTDDEGRVLVEIYLSGKTPLSEFKRILQKLGVEVTAEVPTYARGVLSAYLPLARAVEVARLPGVSSVILSLKPFTNVGTVPPQGASVLKTDLVNGTNCSGFCGAGITVGVLSDSYASATTPPTAADDVASFDLPRAPNNPLNTQSVVVIQDSGTSDEGRGMLQIVHDLAPKAKLCFATANGGQPNFASNILRLADLALGCAASVIVDDIIYLAEPFFSDGIVAQAADTVAGRGIPYFSSAGNRESQRGYLSDVRLIDDAAGRALQGNGENINFALIPIASSAGGFHNFNAGAGTPAVSQTLRFSATGASLFFQWDNPFSLGRVDTDFDLFLFSADGQTLVKSSTGNNLPGGGTDQPIENFNASGLSTALDYQLVITRKATAAPTATKVRYVGFSGVLVREFFSNNTPITFGHNSAAGAQGVAAYFFQTPNTPEGFNSPGPVTIYFDTAGNRLASPQLRLKPDIAAVDGVNTTFFPPGGDISQDPDSFPNFFGTSAAAPHAAGVAALVLEAGGGPGSVTPARLRQIFQSTAAVHDLNPDFVQSIVKSSSGRFSLGASAIQTSAVGDTISASLAVTDPNAFKVTYTGGVGLNQLTLNLASAGVVFDPAGFPFTVSPASTITAAQVTASLSANNTTLTLTFTAGAFTSGQTLIFGIDRDLVAAYGQTAANNGGNGADFIGGQVTGQGSTVVFIDSNGTNFTGRAANILGRGYAYLDGFGLIDALAAVGALP